ncbi:LysE family translocator [Saccharopolyspora flava]|uniref:Threonine/homoserine/homoserine lactone efflux protein n=1 Tax=Saccharopolyspora flava TaxID=95161 RepID=A0A1I6QHV5_9PSEU|nr:LysE family translocator [Saccharopolyspora flava]SFS52067.1 Threonine/homoserine/homoserine lactone efflux protein [Saccharopolyspora flava]
MVDLQRLIAFCAMSLLLSAIPGPSVLFVVGRALAHGRRAALSSALGNALGGYVLVVAVAFGLGTVVAQSALVFTAVKLCGAAYLIHLGVQALRSPAPEVDAAPPVPGRRRIWEGVLVGVSNPKSIVFLMAVLPQFVDRDAGGVIGQMLVLGLAGALLQLLSDSTWGLTASAARAWFGRSPRRLTRLTRTGGATMIGLGVTIALTGRSD